MATLAELKRHLQLWDDASYDDELTYLLTVATTHVENHIGVALADLDPASPAAEHAVLMTAAELFEVRTETTDAKERRAAITAARLLSAYKSVVV